MRPTFVNHASEKQSSSRKQILGKRFNWKTKKTNQTKKNNEQPKKEPCRLLIIGIILKDPKKYLCESFGRCLLWKISFPGWSGCWVPKLESLWDNIQGYYTIARVGQKFLARTARFSVDHFAVQAMVCHAFPSRFMHFPKKYPADMVRIFTDHSPR